MSSTIARSGTLSLIAVLIAWAASPVSAQRPELHGLDGFWEPKFDREPYGQVLIDALPADVTMIDDTGDGELALGEYGGLELSARALADIEHYDAAIEQSPEGACVTPSVAFYMQAPFPMEIYEGRDLIVFKMEYYDLFRVIFLDGRGHPPADAPRTKSGHSVGHWEGDTLVVDTTHVAGATFMNNGFNHSDDMHIVERMRLSPDGTTLWMTQLYDDPDTFDGMAARYFAFTRSPGQFVFPFDCQPDYLQR